MRLSRVHTGAMMSSFASDRSSELALQLNCSPGLLSHPTRQPGVAANLKQLVLSSSKQPASAAEAQSKLPALLGVVDLRDQFNRTSVPNKQLLAALEALVISGDGSEGPEAGPAEIRSILLIQIVLRSYSTLFDSLCHQSFRLKDQIEYWSTVENNRLSTVYYLVQSIPSRSIELAAQIWARTRRAIDQLREDDHNRHRPSTWARQLYHQTWARPHQPISISSFFPILSTNTSGLLNSPAHSIQFLSTLSPILLTRQEARVKRQALELVHAELAEKIGCLVNGLHNLEDEAQRPADSDVALSDLVSKMVLVTSELDSQAEKPTDGYQPTDMVEQLHQLLSNHLPNYPDNLKIRISPLSPPGFFARNWPWLVSLPVLSYALSSLACSYRSKILDGFRYAKDTLKGFISGWVIRPVDDILQTLRAGQEGTLAIMTKDSLAPELDSLERMVVEFGRDKLKWSDEELSKLSERVKEGNLTSVLKVWEQEIKAPIRSAIAGSLIRVLLIQIQKLKVDLSLAMDGIQSVLRSQSLTFGAIGVAPSMLICFMFGKLFGSLIRQRIGVVGKGTKAVRKEVRIAMRRMERTLLLITSNPSADSAHPTAKSHSNNPERTLGLLFLDLHLLRYFVHSPHFPRRESSEAIQHEFLADIKDLESYQLSWKTKAKLAKRFVKQWGFLVGI
ncbi:hypothetical protein PTTG_26936 [Puccinia triticina 1-1 BBBD Race 1]|uniref:Nuclear control of ATPase protein 2 n=2 Tax=Puccinia triticina TaxID=208348 RepID=A0A180GP67_PUCT1|nr:uncharacterized protein PtA15_5A148 [Puccinia triticina]OAV94607.1 hypothetical protein PTTG_26936 [Puccinia triticina 1-1 BBBD Race 1]WAQ84578.1 hypothetical protein PtA15_5A148 [Puccinia triticina]